MAYMPLVLTSDQRSGALGALASLADLDGARSPHEASLLEVVAQTLGGADLLSAGGLPSPSPEALAALLPDPAHRVLLVQGLIVMAMMDGVVTADEVARVREVAAAFEVDEPRIRFLDMFAKGRIEWLRRELPMRSEMIQGKVKEAWEARGVVGVAELMTFPWGLIGCEQLAARYDELEQLPEGTFGRIYFDHMKARGFRFPGQKKAFPEVLVAHDLSHILAGFDTDAVGECEVIAFIAGYIRADPFWYIFMILTHMHLDVEVFIGDPTARLAGDPRRMADAYLRGLQVNTDLYDRWDFWVDFPLQLEEVRRKYNVLPVP